MDVALVLAVIAVIKAGLYAMLWWGSRSAGDHPESADRGIGTVDGAVFALLGFMLAFAFSGAQTRLENRQSAIVKEANAISTAYLRSDLLPQPARDQAKALFRSFLTHRLEGAERLPDWNLAKQSWDKSHEEGQQLWSLALGQTLPGQDRMLVLESLNEMLDSASAREAAARIHAPMPILTLLFALAALSAFLAGRALRSENAGATRIHRLALSLCFGAVLGVLLDMEHPRLGMIRLGSGDAAMGELSETVGIPMD